MKKASLLHKILSASLAVTIVGGVFAATPIGTMLGTDITVSAASSSPVVTAGAEDGESPYVYGVYYKKASAEKWSTAQSYKDNTSVTFKPGAAVTYDVCVKVKDSTGKIEKKYFVLTVTK